MLTTWTSEDIEIILGQLNSQNFPFKRYSFALENGKYVLLGKGASANVYRAETREKHKMGYAIKVIGFSDKHVESESFRNSVNVQEDLGQFQDNVVKIYDSVELRVWIESNNTVTKIEKIDPYEEEKIVEGNFLHLQFILMEEIEPVLIDNRYGKPTLRPHELASFDEKEILKMAYDIGTALAHAHAKKLIHRDIKLENIFYSASGGHYKLGDFGIARTTDDGLASTVAFTKGYGAPEVVGTMEDKYDYTADIYSFGMLLYVLLNELKFPGSKNYYPNVMQYARGFEAEYPANGSDELCDIVLKMIRFDPDDRYQTIDEVLNEFDKLKYGRRVKYQREHKATSLVVGASFALLGAVAFEVSYVPEFITNLSIWLYVFWGLCIWKGITKLRKQGLTWVSLMLLVIGVWLMISTGFTWWKLLGVIFLSCYADVSTGIIGGSVLIMKLTQVVMEISSIRTLPEYNWISILFVSLSIFLLFYHYILGERNEKVVKFYLQKNLYWIVATLFYASMALTESAIHMSSNTGFNIYERLFGKGFVDAFLNLNPEYLGIAGTVFCVIWIMREWLLIFIEKRIYQKK